MVVECLAILVIPLIHRAGAGFGEGEMDRVEWGYDLRVASQMVEERQAYLVKVDSRDENWDSEGSI
jgi:hypothetical protein